MTDLSLNAKALGTPPLGLLSERQSWCRQTRGGRCRAGTARTYLHPPLKRPNLQLVTKRLVYRVLFDGKRAAGVEFSRASCSRARPRR
jgi:choline dehydrogenase